MSYADGILLPNERIVARSKPHIAWLLPLSLIAVTLALFAPLTRGATGALLILFSPWLVWGYLSWTKIEYLITDRRVLSVGGVIARGSADVGLDKVNEILMQESVLGRLMEYGSVTVFAGNDRPLRLRYVPKAADFKLVITNTRQGYASKQFAATSPQPRPCAASSPSIAPAPRQASVADVNFKSCPECAETVQAAATICRFCRHSFG